MKFSLFYVVLPLGMIQSVAAIDWGRMCDGKSGQGDCATFRSDVSGKCGMMRLPLVFSSLKEHHFLIYYG